MTFINSMVNGKWYDLGQGLNKQTPIWPNHPPYFMTINNRHNDLSNSISCEIGSSNEIIITSGHHSTHIDALSHISNNNKLYGDVDVADAMTKGPNSFRGFKEGGVEQIEPIIKRGVLLDIAKIKEKQVLNKDDQITKEDLQLAVRKQNVDIREGDCVFIRTGWMQYWDSKEKYLGEDGYLPGPDISAAKWLADQKIFLSGSDTIFYEFMSPDITPLVHPEFLAKRGIYIIECLNLEELAHEAVYEFLFIALPLKIEGATGSPIRPIALIPGEN